MEMKFMHNTLYEIRERRRKAEMEVRKRKKLRRQIGVSRTKASIPMCVMAGEDAVKLMKKYPQSVMDSLDLPSSRQLRESKEYRLRSIEARKSRRAVELKRIRKARVQPLTDEQKQRFLDDVVIETDVLFEQKEALVQYRATVNGKIETALIEMTSMPMWTGTQP